MLPETWVCLSSPAILSSGALEQERGWGLAGKAGLLSLTSPLPHSLAPGGEARLIGLATRLCRTFQKFLAGSLDQPRRRYRPGEGNNNKEASSAGNAGALGALRCKQRRYPASPHLLPQPVSLHRPRGHT